MMYSTAILVAASAAVASAQVVYNETTGIFSCPTVPNGVYCAGDSLTTNIIFRCVNGTAHPGNCNDNLAGYFPYGVQAATCYQPDTTSGTAACAKNCIVQGGSGNSPTFTLPNCTPLVESSTTSVASSTSTPAPTTTAADNSTSTSTTITSTGTTICTTDGTTITKTFTTTYCPESTTSVVPTTTLAPTLPLSTFTTSISVPLSTGGTTLYPNGTTTAGSSTKAGTTTGSATATPIKPTTTTTASNPGFTGAAMANSAGLGLSMVGLFIAYFL